MLLTGLPGSPNTVMAFLLPEASMVANVSGFPGFILTCTVTCTAEAPDLMCVTKQTQDECAHFSKWRCHAPGQSALCLCAPGYLL